MDRGKIGFCSVIVLWYISSWRLTLVAKLGSHFVFHECLLCILKILLTLSGVAQLVDQREAPRRRHPACSLVPCSCRFLEEDGSWSCPGHIVLPAEPLAPQGSAGRHMPMLDTGSFPVCVFNGLLALGHKTRNFGHSSLKKNVNIYWILFFMHVP